jgi:hypothetical protein
MTYPYPLFRVPGGQALKMLSDLRLKDRGTPVILGENQSFERVSENMELNSEQSVEDLVALAREIVVQQWLEQRAAADPEFYEIEPKEWPENTDSPNTTITSHCSVLTGKPHAEVVITVLPTEEPWKVPCFLRIGDWNEVPKAEEHAALFKHWAERYGAKIACIADDVIELTVERPAATREEALALARQHFIYCADIVHQGVGSVEELAATLLGATVWYFWWD